MCKVTVVIPYYNSEKTILRALLSVKNQTYKDYEVIMINDGSTDSSYQIVEEFIKDNMDINLKNIYQNNKGPSSARNVGIVTAKGEYIAFLDSDDEWVDTKLENQIKLLDNYDIDLLGCNFYYYKNEKEIKHFYVEENLKRISFKELLFKHYFATPCVIVKKSAIIDVGCFLENQNYMEDALLFLKIARKYNTYISNDFLTKTYKYPFGESGLSKKIYDMEKYELLNFKMLRKENKKSSIKINIILYAFIIIFSLMKYVRRSIIVFFRGLSNI